MSSSEATVIAAIEAVFHNKGLQPPHLTGETRLDASLGLESLDYAEIVVRLDGVYGKDPFATGAVPQIRTIADLASLYD